METKEKRFMVCTTCHKEYWTAVYEPGCRCYFCGKGSLQVKKMPKKMRKAMKKHAEQSNFRFGGKDAKHYYGYLNDAVHCPFCKSKYITFIQGQIRDCVGNDTNFCSRPMVCMTCQGCWFDVYKLWDIDIIKYPAGYKP